MINRLLFFLVLFSFVFFSCETNETKIGGAVYPEIFAAVLEAHGGLDKWRAMQTFTYTRGTGTNAEKHTIDLSTRKSLIEVEGKYKLGFDGTDVWVSPHRDSFPGRSPRFTHNLHFYFAAIPFVFADPGVTLTHSGQETIDSQLYDVLNVSFGENIGDAPDDQYNMYVNPTTKQVDFITYSVTYFDASKATNYNALKYEWTDANGLLAPERYIGFKWENSSLGAQRYKSDFSNVNYLESPPDSLLFEIPQGAFIDRMESEN